MVRTFLKVYMELSSYFLFLQEQIKDIIIVNTARSHANQMHQYQLLHLSTKLASGVSGILCASRVGQGDLLPCIDGKFNNVLNCKVTHNSTIK